tara:strand:- start:1879 stop:2040 length:162 start_codon:yes stop_codon:yes gene_type:complete
MAKMYIMGKYSEKAFLGFLKDPTTDRKAAVEKLTSAAGGKCYLWILLEDHMTL